MAAPASSKQIREQRMWLSKISKPTSAAVMSTVDLVNKATSQEQALQTRGLKVGGVCCAKKGWIQLLGEMKDEGLFAGDYVDKALVQLCFRNIIQVRLEDSLM